MDKTNQKQTRQANTIDVFQDTISKAFNPNFIPSKSKIDTSAQLFQHDSKQATKHIAEFMNYLQQNGQGNLVQDNRVKDLSLRTPPKSSKSDIIITDPDVAQAYRKFLSPPALQIIPVTSQQAMEHLREFSKFLQQNGQQHLLQGGIIKGVSLETLSGGSQAQIKVTDPEVAKAYTLFANTVKTQVIHIEDKKAIAHLRDFAVYLKQTGQVQFIDSVSGKIKDVLLKIPPGSTQTQIMFQDPAVFQAYQTYANSKQSLVLKINAKEAVAHLKDFATYLQQYGQGNLISSATGKIQGISLTTPKGSTQAEITFENPGIAQAYTNFVQVLQQKIMDANKLMKTNLQGIVESEQKELNAGEFTYPKF